MRVSLPVYSEADYLAQAQAACAGLPPEQAADVMAAYEADKAAREHVKAIRQAEYDNDHARLRELRGHVG